MSLLSDLEALRAGSELGEKPPLLVVATRERGLDFAVVVEPDGK
jgi:hypothetical protein